MAIAKRKKRFFEVEIPLLKKETHLIAFEKQELNGKYLKYDITRNLKGKPALMQFKVLIKNEKAIAYPQQLRLLPVCLKRMVRKGTNYVEDSFSTKTKDAKVRIKPFLVTRRRVSRKVKKALRQKAREELTKTLKNNKIETIFEEILKNKLQKELSLKLKKIYPLSACEIKILKIENYLEKKK